MFVTLPTTSGAPTLAARKTVVTCATKPQFKGAKKMAHRRPKKSNPSDRRHGPAEYAPLPVPPPEYTVVSQ